MFPYRTACIVASVVFVINHWLHSNDAPYKLSIISDCSLACKEYSNEVTTNFNKILSGVYQKYSTCETENYNLKRFVNDTLPKFGKEQEERVTNLKNKVHIHEVIITLLFVGVFIWTIILVNVKKKLNALCRQPEHRAMSLTSAVPHGEIESHRRSVAIVSFSDTRKTAYIDLMKDITADVKTMYHGVSRKDDYFEIMSKVAILLVERNDRHIILESEHEIGDLKVSCVRYVQQCGGHVIVVYCGHKQSDSMGDLLCSPELTSADRHRELRALKNENCFLSINKTFSHTQKKHIQSKLKMYLDIN